MLSLLNVPVWFIRVLWYYSNLVGLTFSRCQHNMTSVIYFSLYVFTNRIIKDSQKCKTKGNLDVNCAKIYTYEYFILSSFTRDLQQILHIHKHVFLLWSWFLRLTYLKENEEPIWSKTVFKTGYYKSYNNSIIRLK